MVFGAATEQAARYAELLSTAGIEWGLLGPREADRIWDRHLLNSAALAPLVPNGVAILDVGSGAGLPGIPLALARPDLHVTLVEPLARRVRFLELVRAELGLALNIRPNRAEAMFGVLEAPVVTARALAPLDRLLRWTWPLLAPGGTLLAVKGDDAPSELARFTRAWPADRRGDPQIVRCRGVDGAVLATVVRFDRAQVG